MTARELFDAIGRIDDDLILSADKPASKRTVRLQFRRLVPMAACLCFLAVGSLALLRGGYRANSAASSAEAQLEAAVPYAAATNPDAGQEAAEGSGDTAFSLQAQGSLQPYSALLLGTDANGTGGLLAHSAQELFFSENASLLSTAADSLPVYRSDTLDGGIREAEMRALLQQILSALGMDGTLADSAVLTADDEETQEQTVQEIRAQTRSGDAESILLDYWSSAATLTLEVPAEETGSGMHITVNNDLCASILFDRDGTLHVLADADDAHRTAAALRERYDAVFTALLGEDYQERTDSDGCSYDGEPSTLCVTFGADSFRLLDAAVSEDGELLSLHLTARSLTELGEYRTVTRQEADERLAAGEYLCSSEEDSVEEAIAALSERLVSLRLVYPGARAAYCLPMWEYVLDTGADNRNAALHRYAVCYVPAVELSDIAALNNGSGA